jgi:2-polyprenyl-3-methyl-5-hydroxy-6-metoxy-1,4-benzoquinol methylase
MLMDNSFNEKRYAQSAFTLESSAEKGRIGKSISLLQAHRPRRILDVGCTDGLISGVIKARTGGYVIGMDASSPAIEKAKAICDEAYVVEFGKGSLPIPDASVDGIFAGEIIEHVFHTEDFLEELHRVAAPGACLVISTPNLAAWFNRVFVLLGLQPLFTDTGVRFSAQGNWLIKPSLPPGHIRNFTLSSLRHLLKVAGWTTVSAHGQGILSNKLRYLDKPISTLFPSLASDMILVCRKD